MDIRKELSDKEIKQRTKDIDYICKDECGQYDIRWRRGNGRKNIKISLS